MHKADGSSGLNGYESESGRGERFAPLGWSLCMTEDSTLLIICGQHFVDPVRLTEHVSRVRVI